MIHPVKVYDQSGKLKKVISQKILKRRSDEICLNPSLFIKQTKGRKKKVQTIQNYVGVREINILHLSLNLHPSRRKQGFNFPDVIFSPYKNYMIKMGYGLNRTPSTSLLVDRGKKIKKIGHPLVSYDPKLDGRVVFN